MTVTGLVTYPVSQLTLAQQILLFILMTIGNLIINSVVMVFLRRHFFGKKFKHLVKKSASVRARMQDIEDQEHKQHQEEMNRMRHFFGLRSTQQQSGQLPEEQRKHSRRPADKNKTNGSSKRPKLHAGMVQRMDEPARQVNPTGHMTTMVANMNAPEFFQPVPSTTEEPAISSILQTSDAPEPFKEATNDSSNTGVRIMEPGQDSISYPNNHPPTDSILSQDQPIVSSPQEETSVKIADPVKNSDRDTTHNATGLEHDLPNDAANQTDLETPERRRMADFQSRHPSKEMPLRRKSLDQSDGPKPGKTMRRHHTVSFSDDANRSMGHVMQAPQRAKTTMSQDPFAMRTFSMARTNTMQTDRGGAQRRRGTALQRTMTRNKDKGLGGFPTPLELGMGIIESLHLKKQFQVPRSATLASRPGRSMTIDSDTNRVRLAPYLTFDAEVRGNSHFHNLNHAQRNELGGVEYRAIDVLAWLIPSYWLFWVLLSIIITTPYLMSSAGAEYRDAMQQQEKPPHNAVWYWIFNTVSSLTNTGMSLADSSYQGTLGKAYMLLIPSIVLILVGNTAYPVMLRSVIWIMTKCVGESSHLYETLQFLLDHPRRCFVYLFPREKTWFLFGLVVLLTLIDWFFIMILDLEKRFEWPSIGIWVFDSFFQSIAVRSAGLQTFNIVTLVPAEQMLQVFMMYLAAFPLAMAVRTTNVYEEGSLGVYEDVASPEEDDNDQGYAVWGRFLSEQVRRQVAFDLWWIALALWIVLIAEKSHIGDFANFPNFTVFTVTYEMISAYGTVGLSCGSQDGTASLSRDFSVLSKLIMISVMIRGRHRGLPSAIDRAIMLPSELHAYDQTHDAHFGTSLNEEDQDSEANGPVEMSQNAAASYSERNQDPEHFANSQDSAQSTGVKSTMSDDGMHRIWSRPRESSISNNLAPIDETSSGTQGMSSYTPAKVSPDTSKSSSIHSL
ncbi:hypothetical protein MYAM1_002974 [Malassezia yamatoensis]|uniref:Potassium transport protein n=1 Tax=Malassezia yamatoensis TaxID=253288 RepID=A0AAJ6CIG4_9BASI|nr:hypothetical protein MYAM1_002974 [Malassezia yamatoensis]